MFHQVAGWFIPLAGVGDYIPPEADVRITQDDQIRITENGDVRVTED